MAAGEIIGDGGFKPDFGLGKTPELVGSGPDDETGIEFGPLAGGSLVGRGSGLSVAQSLSSTGLTVVADDSSLFAQTGSPDGPGMRAVAGHAATVSRRSLLNDKIGLNSPYLARYDWSNNTTANFLFDAPLSLDFADEQGQVRHLQVATDNLGCSMLSDVDSPAHAIPLTKNFKTVGVGSTCDFKLSGSHVHKQPLCAIRVFEHEGEKFLEVANKYLWDALTVRRSEPLRLHRPDHVRLLVGGEKLGEGSRRNQAYWEAAKNLRGGDIIVFKDGRRLQILSREDGNRYRVADITKPVLSYGQLKLTDLASGANEIYKAISYGQLREGDRLFFTDGSSSNILDITEDGIPSLKIGTLTEGFNRAEDCKSELVNHKRTDVIANLAYVLRDGEALGPDIWIDEIGQTPTKIIPKINLNARIRVSGMTVVSKGDVTVAIRDPDEEQTKIDSLTVSVPVTQSFVRADGSERSIKTFGILPGRDAGKTLCERNAATVSLSKNTNLCVELGYHYEEGGTIAAEARTSGEAATVRVDYDAGEDAYICKTIKNDKETASEKLRTGVTYIVGSDVNCKTKVSPEALTYLSARQGDSIGSETLVMGLDSSKSQGISVDPANPTVSRSHLAFRLIESPDGKKRLKLVNLGVNRVSLGWELKDAQQFIEIPFIEMRNRDCVIDRLVKGDIIPVVQHQYEVIGVHRKDLILRQVTVAPVDLAQRMLHQTPQEQRETLSRSASVKVLDRQGLERFFEIASRASPAQSLKVQIRAKDIAKGDQLIWLDGSVAQVIDVQVPNQGPKRPTLVLEHCRNDGRVVTVTPQFERDEVPALDGRKLIARKSLLSVT